MSFQSIACASFSFKVTSNHIWLPKFWISLDVLIILCFTKIHLSWQIYTFPSYSSNSIEIFLHLQNSIQHESCYFEWNQQEHINCYGSCFFDGVFCFKVIKWLAIALQPGWGKTNQSRSNIKLGKCKRSYSVTKTQVYHLQRNAQLI